MTAHCFVRVSRMDLNGMEREACTTGGEEKEQRQAHIVLLFLL